MYLTNNLEELTLPQIASRHPNVILNSNWSGGVIDGISYTRIDNTVPPTVGQFQTAVRGNPYITGGIARVDWAVTEIDIEQARALKYAEINSWRDAQESGGFEWNGHLWDSDSTAIKRMSSVFPSCLNGIDPPTGYWTTATNVNVQMNANEFVQMYTAMLLAGGKIHDRQRQMKHMVSTLWSIVDIQNFVVDW